MMTDDMGEIELVHCESRTEVYFVPSKLVICQAFRHSLVLKFPNI